MYLRYYYHVLRTIHTTYIGTLYTRDALCDRWYRFLSCDPKRAVEIVCGNSSDLLGERLEPSCAFSVVTLPWLNTTASVRQTNDR